MGMNDYDPYCDHREMAHSALTLDGMSVQVKAATRRSFQCYCNEYGELQHQGICYDLNEFSSSLNRLLLDGWEIPTNIQGGFRIHCLSMDNPFIVGQSQYLIAALILKRPGNLAEICFASNDHSNKRDFLQEIGNTIVGFNPNYEFIVSFDGNFAPIRRKTANAEQ